MSAAWSFSLRDSSAARGVELRLVCVCFASHTAAHLPAADSAPPPSPQAYTPACVPPRCTLPTPHPHPPIPPPPLQRVPHASL
eukprot:9280110-Prorocentrum_lima.AAC.1